MIAPPIYISISCMYPMLGAQGFLVWLYNSRLRDKGVVHSRDPVKVRYLNHTICSVCYQMFKINFVLLFTSRCSKSLKKESKVKFYRSRRSIFVMRSLSFRYCAQ